MPPSTPPPPQLPQSFLSSRTQYPHLHQRIFDKPRKSAILHKKTTYVLYMYMSIYRNACGARIHCDAWASVRLFHICSRACVCLWYVNVCVTSPPPPPTSSSSSYATTGARFPHPDPTLPSVSLAAFWFCSTTIINIPKRVSARASKRTNSLFLSPLTHSHFIHSLYVYHSHGIYRPTCCLP